MSWDTEEKSVLLKEDGLERKIEKAEQKAKRVKVEIEKAEQEVKREIQMSETTIVGILLALVGGFLDAYTYLCRGKVFANAQTGNIVLFGIKLSEGDWRGGFYYCLPILAFAVGVILSERIRSKFGHQKQFHWRQMIILSEILILLATLLVPRGDWDMIANIMVSFVCSLQVQSFRKFDGYACATTMCTGNLRSGTEHLNKYLNTKSKASLKACIHYYRIILFFIVGAFLGAVLTNGLGVKAIVLACVGLLLVFFLMFRREAKSLGVC
ncbi:MAG: DUF1275 family protein [Hespellia sp.]|nr:DUF1275 family protein [Hespellia sp.]